MSDVSVTAGAISEADVAGLTGLRLPKWQRFVAAYCSGANTAAAVLGAGYTSKNPKQFANKLLRRPEIAEAVKGVRAHMAKRARYGQDDLIAELNGLVEFARETKNATAAVRATELKGKVLGLIVDRLDARVQQVPFRIDINTELQVLPPIPMQGGSE